MPIGMAPLNFSGKLRRQLLWGTALMAMPALVLAFQSGDTGGEMEVVIKREAIRLTDARNYYVEMHLDSAKSIEFTAPADGIVRTVSVKPGQKIRAQGEAFRLDDTRAALVLKRAKANLQAAQIEKRMAAAKGDGELSALAEAKLESAQAETELAQFEADQLIIRAPFNGEILRVNVSDGQFVRAGEKLGVLIDATKLVVEVPAERSSVAVGGTIDLKVEDAVVKAKVDSVAALSPKFGALRELTTSPVSAFVSIENPSEKLAAGQTVYSELIPLSPVVVVATTSVANGAEGIRKVKVLRDNVIRDVPVRVMAKVGTDAVYLSGRFNEGDEVIVYSSRDLLDGTPLRALAGGPPATPSAVKNSQRPAGPGKSPANSNKTQEGF